LAQHLKLMSTESDLCSISISFVPDWLKLTGAPHPPGYKAGGEAKETLKFVPLLYQDPVVLLLTLVMHLHPHFTPLLFGIIVQAVFNLVFFQGLVDVTTRLSSEERSAWQKDSSTSASPGCTSTEALMKMSINSLDEVGLFADDEWDDDELQICGGTVMSPASVEAAIGEACLPFLRIAALLKARLFDSPLPEITTMDHEFILLAEFLGLGKPVPVSSGGMGRTSTTIGALRAPPPPSFRHTPQLSTFLYWEAVDPNFKAADAQETSRLASLEAVVTSWCHQLRSICAKNGKEARSLIPAVPGWQPPCLVRLPERYDQIFRFYRSAHCQQCDAVPKEPAVCLVCGRICCFKSSSCCIQDGRRECTSHALDCGAGTGIYLAMNSSVVVLIRGARVALWGSVYLDSHGEEDRDLKRGRPLFLSRDRYELLQRQWLMHAFDHAVKNWGWHNDRL